jgi:hypothetical protein
MSEVQKQWRELCLEAVGEPDPERRMAIVVELGRILRKDVHHFKPLRVDLVRGKVERNGRPVYLTNLEFVFFAILLNKVAEHCLVENFCDQSGVIRAEHSRGRWIFMCTGFARSSSRMRNVLN